MDLSNAVRVWFEAVNYGEPLRVRTALHVYDDLFEIDTAADIRHVIGDPDAIRMQVKYWFGIKPIAFFSHGSCD